MKILITGGTGLIGRSLIKASPQHNYTVLTRSVKSARNILPDSVKYQESLSLIDTLDDYDAVINLAGEPIIDKRWSQQQKSIICRSRWDITEQLVEKFRASSNPPKVFISGSAIGIYGEQGKQTVDEQKSCLYPDFAQEVCQQWESLAQEAEPFTRLVLLRIGIVLSPQGGALAKMLLPFKYGLGGKIGNGEQYYSWIHIDDTVAAIQFLIDNEDCSGAFNLTAPAPVINQQFTQALATILHRPALLPMPAGILKLAMGESASLLLASQRVIPNKLATAGFTFRHPQLESALQHLLR